MSRNSGGEPQTQKAELRRRIRAILGGLAGEARLAGSRRACLSLQQQAVWRQAQTVLLYAPFGAELDVWPLVEAALVAGKTVALPRYLSERDGFVAGEIRNLAADVRPGRFGIREPAVSCATVELYLLDFVLVPGLAFDLHGRRLGRGKGFYDQLLRAVRGCTCGVAFDEQIVGEVPVKSHDVQLNCILTPTRWVEL
jgi:5-formyltetrahydrofolate cyclo-ligase